MPAAGFPTRPSMRLPGGIVLAALGCAVILSTTLWPNSGVMVGQSAACCSASDIMLNVLLFMPLGAGLALLGWRPWGALVTGAMFSALIEFAQYGWIAGRFASVADVAANVAGSLLGVLVVLHWDRRARWWPKVGAAVAVLVVLVWLLGGQVVRPAVPGPAQWVVEWGSGSDGSRPFGGQILEVSLQGIPLVPGPVADQPVLRALLTAADTSRLTALIVTGPDSNCIAEILEVRVGAGRLPFLILRQENQDILAYQRLGLSWVGLQSPWLSLDRALAAGPGDTVRVVLTATRRELRLAAARDGDSYESRLTLSPDLYLNALLLRASNGALPWRLIPALLSMIVLGLALARHPRVLAVACLVALFLGANRGGVSYPEWPVVMASFFGSWAGWRLGRAVGLVERGEAAPAASEVR